MATQGITAFYPNVNGGISGFVIQFPPAWSTQGKMVFTVNSNPGPILQNLGGFVFHVWSGGTYTVQNPDPGTSNQFTIYKPTAAGIGCGMTIQVVQTTPLIPPGPYTATYAQGMITENPQGVGSLINCTVTNVQTTGNTTGISIGVVLSGGGGM